MKTSAEIEIEKLDEILPGTIQKIGIFAGNVLVIRIMYGEGVGYIYCAPHPLFRAFAWGEESPGCRYPDAHVLHEQLRGKELLRVCKVSDENVIEFVLSDGIKLYVHYFGRKGNAILVDGEGKVMHCVHASKSHEPGSSYKRTGKDSPSATTAQIVLLSTEELLSAVCEQYRHELRQQIKAYCVREYKRLSRRLEKIQEDAGKAERAEEYKRLGEILKANYHLLARGMTSIEAIDVYDPAQKKIEIELDPALSAQENVVRYFNLAKKWVRAPKKIQERYAQTQKEIAGLDALLQRADEEEGIAELEKMLPRPKKARKKKKQRDARGSGAPKIRQYETSEGYTIYAGRNAKENDYVTIRVANGNDIWMHTRNMPGAHVVMRKGSEMRPDKKAILEAARLCAYLSNVPDGEVIEVTWTRAKHVSKPKHAKPGLVYVAQGKTVAVRVDNAAMKEWERTHRK